MNPRRARIVLRGKKGGLMLKTQLRQWLKVLTFRNEPFPGILFVTALGILPVTLVPQLYYAFYAALSMNTAAKATAFFGVLCVVFLSSVLQSSFKTEESIKHSSAYR